MNNKIYFHTECDYSLDKNISIVKMIERTFKVENKNFEIINIIFCGDEDLLKKNITYLKHKTYTDIITFNYSKNNIVSGDLYISVERVKENASTYKVNFIEELRRVIIHGILHLIGYNDKTEEEKVLIRKKEDFYLSLRCN